MKTALIYTRGNNGYEQLVKCEKYAKEKGYNIIGVTATLDEAFEVFPNVLLVSDVSRITRNRYDYEMIKKSLDRIGTKIESA